MSETKHTPLPWKATQDVGGRWHVDSGYRGDGTDYIPVADLRNDGEGNANLIVTSVNARPKVEELVRMLKKAAEVAASKQDRQEAATVVLDLVLPHLGDKAREVEEALGGKAE